MISNFYRGDTLDFNITLADKNGAPVDLTGASIWFTLKSAPTDSDVNAKLQVKQTTFTDPTNGFTIFTVPADKTSDLIPNTIYYYDFQIVFPNGTVKTLLSGKVKVLQDITLSK